MPWPRPDAGVYRDITRREFYVQSEPDGEKVKTDVEMVLPSTDPHGDVDEEQRRRV